MSKFVLFVFVAIVAAVAAETIEIDWSKVKRLTDYPEFWEGKSFKPSTKHSGKFKYEEVNQRVANGINAERHEFPFKTALISEMPFGPVLCGGSLISRWAVLTAAHCIHGASDSIVILGASDISNPSELFQARFRVPSANYRIHPLFREGVTNSDIGIVRFSFEIAFFTQAVNIVQLPTEAMVNDLFASESALVMGFGQNSATGNLSPSLQFVEVSTMANAGITGCSLRFPGMIDTSHICTSGLFSRGWCSGDEGAPLVILTNGRFMQIGIASIFPDSGCTSGNPSVYTRVTSFLAFIQQNM